MHATMERTPWRGATAVESNPLEEARTWLRKATCVPYEVRDPGAWLREFQPYVAGARRMLAARVAFLRQRQFVQPWLTRLADREVQEHEQAARMADALFTEAYLATEPDLLDMVELTESAKVLEKQVERLRERRSDLFFESTYRDLGGGG